jgi:hypothetical protein
MGVGQICACIQTGLEGEGLADAYQAAAKLKLDQLEALKGKPGGFVGGLGQQGVGGCV